MERDQLEAGIAALEAQRALLGDAVAEAALAPLRAKLSALPMLAQPPASAQTLKQVTILFLDVVGSTTLSQHLDPEEIHSVMDGALARCTAIVKSHDGKVLQYAGDSLLAVFGADVAREDAPERAVRAGLSLLAEGRHQGELVARQHGREGFSFRVGLHTGSVLLGGGVDAEGSIREIAVSIAARMEQTAPAGTLRISRDTYRHVRGLFEVEPQRAMPVKGLDEPFVTYLVLRAKPRAFRVAARGIEGVATRMVGRDFEFAQLREAFKALFEKHKLIAVTVVGEAGVGKSRLLCEFENWIRTRPERFTVFQGRATPQTQGQPYGLLRDILGWWLQFADSDSMQVAKQRIEQGIGPLFAADDGQDLAQAHAHLLGHLIGLDFGDSAHIQGIRDEGKQIRDRGFHAAAQMFRRVAAHDGAPIILLLEDLHWADDESLDFLAHLAQINREVPMLIFGLTRPTLFERPTNWPGNADVHRIELNPLDESASRQLAIELLKKLPEAPAALHTLIIGGAEGNPFYMEELVNMLVDQGAIEAGPGRWKLHPDKLLATHVPQTLTGVLQARLDGLPAAERRTLQEASVIGFVFWDQALAAIDPQAGLMLPALVRRALTLPRQDASLEGMREYVFRQQILHHVTYDTLLKRARSELHAKVAAWLAGLTDTHANDFLGATAEHYEKAGNYEQAAEFYTRAAEHAKDRYAHEAALSHVERALALVSVEEHRDSAVLRWRLLDVRLNTLRVQDRCSEQQAAIAALQELADEMNDDQRRGEAALRRSEFSLRVADYATMQSAARQAIALAERTGDDVQKLQGQALLAGSVNRLGDAVAAKALAQQGLAAARSRGLPHVEVRFLTALGGIAAGLGDLMATLEIDQQTLLIRRKIGNRSGEAAALVNLGESWLRLGDNREARHHLEEGLRLIRAIGAHAGEPYLLIMLSLTASRESEYVLALTRAKEALDFAVTLRHREAEILAFLNVGEAELALGRHAAAAEALERAYALASTADSVNRHDASACLARLALASGDVAAARLAIEGLLAHLAGRGSLKGTNEQRIRLTCWQVLAHTGDPRATELLAAAQTELQARAATITDAKLRQSFLSSIPEHREIVAAWAALRASGSGSD